MKICSPHLHVHRWQLQWLPLALWSERCNGSNIWCAKVGSTVGKSTVLYCCELQYLFNNLLDCFLEIGSKIISIVKPTRYTGASSWFYYRNYITLPGPMNVKFGSKIISIVKPTRCTSVSNLFYFGMTLYMFRTVFPSIIRSSRLHIQQHAFVKQILLSTC
jgi:hypothetical protein